MKVPWDGTRCILCLEEATLCEEHLIPESLGGRLTCEFLCVTCNSTLGHELEAMAKSDPSVLLAAKNLSAQIPELAKTLLESHPLIAQSAPGPAPGYIKNGEFRVWSKTLEDGSLVQPTSDARKSVQRMLQKAGYVDTPLQRAMAAFDEAPEDKKTEIAQGLQVVKWSIQKLEIDLSKSRLMNPLIPAKTAYEFLALLLGSAICEGYPQLAEIRQCIRGKALDPKAIAVERLSSDKYEPFHGICFERNEPYAKVQIRLFGWLAFRVHFLHLAIGTPRLGYTCRLDNGEEYVRTINGPEGS